MADPTTTENAAGSAASGSTGQSTANDLAAVIAQAVAAGVTSSLQEITNKLNQISQAVRNTSTTDDTNMEVSSVGTDDPNIGMRNERVIHNQIHAQMLRLLSAGVDHYIDSSRAYLMGMAATAVQSGRHADVAVGGHWSTAPGTANPAIGPAK